MDRFLMYFGDTQDVLMIQIWEIRISSRFVA